MAVLQFFWPENSRMMLLQQVVNQLQYYSKDHPLSSARLWCCWHACTIAVNDWRGAELQLLNWITSWK